MLKEWAKFVCVLVILISLDGFLIYLPAFTPVPRQGAKSTAEAGESSEKHSGPEHNPTPPLSTRGSTIQSLATPEDSKEQAAHHEGEKITVVSLPDISIVKDQKGFWDHVFDWGPWASNALLVVVGVLQILLLKLTWDQIKRQADTLTTQAGHMAEQLEEMKGSTALARQSAEAALLNAKAATRSAEIAAGVSIPTLVLHEFKVGVLPDTSGEIPTPFDFFQWPNVQITVKNYGQTPALLQWWSICFTCEDLPDVPVYEGPAIGMVLDKRVVLPGDTFTLPGLAFFRRTPFSPEDAQAIVSREKTFTAYGYVGYGDIFGNPLWRFKFCERVLNIYRDGDICDWWSGMAPPDYSGIDHFPTKEKANQPQDYPQPN